MDHNDLPPTYSGPSRYALRDDHVSLADLTPAGASMRMIAADDNSSLPLVPHLSFSLKVISTAFYFLLTPVARCIRWTLLAHTLLTGHLLFLASRSRRSSAPDPIPDSRVSSTAPLASRRPPQTRHTTLRSPAMSPRRARPRASLQTMRVRPLPALSTSHPS